MLARTKVSLEAIIYTDGSFCSYCCQFYDYDRDPKHPHCNLPVLMGLLSVELEEDRDGNSQRIPYCLNLKEAE